jgi:hypothetical protein
MEDLEIFEPLKGYEGLYLINKKGHIKTVRRRGTDERIIRPALCKNGYYAVSLNNKDGGKTFTIHRLLACQYIPNVDNKRCIDHIDRNKINNSLDNLRWVTYTENNQNKNINGHIYIDRFTKNNKEYKYFRAVYKGHKKRFKTLDEANKFLQEIK